jgi:hypothetical protein
MRVIERKMNAAILHRKNWQLDNTAVHYDAENEVSKVYLHGNKIAEVGEGFITLYDGGWQSTTTKSRLSSILKEHGADDGIYQKNFKWFVYNGKTKESEEFASGMTLR